MQGKLLQPVIRGFAVDPVFLFLHSLDWTMNEQPEIVLVAAMGRNRVIGRDGGMPWHLPADLKHFKAVTMDHPIVMGRRTFESIGRALPGRRNIVLSRSLAEAPPGCERTASLEEALEGSASGPLMVIGGGALYRAALPLAARMELTFIDASPDGDTHFPRWSHADWRLDAMRRRPADTANPYALVFCSFSRVQPVDIQPLDIKSSE
ncbi:MAG: dihydrofolate reductase [Wenzhouxiangellaceae bacterium]